MPVRVQRIIDWIERFAQPQYAMPGDKIGLQVGSTSHEVSRVLTTLDLTPEVADEAIERDCQMIIAHHAVIFRPLERLRTDEPRGALLQKLLVHNIAVYVPHTAMDVAPDGINQNLASMLGIVDPRPLRQLGSEPRIMLDVTSEEPLPLHHLGSDIDEIYEVPCKSLQRYHLMTGEATAGHVGRRLSEMGARSVDQIQLRTPHSSWGIGRVGWLVEEMTLIELAEKIKQVLKIPALRLVGARDSSVSVVAVLCGDGNRFLADAVRADADVLVTGDVYYHTALEAQQQGIGLIDPGHHATESLVKRLLVEQLREIAEEEGAPEVEFVASSLNTEPFDFLV